MRALPATLCLLCSLVLAACSGVAVEPAPVDDFAAAGYRYYRWRSEPLPADPRSSDPLYTVDPVLRSEVDRVLQAKGYLLDRERSQFSVDYLFAEGLVAGATPGQADNISPVPLVIPNRGVDQASIDNAIALGGVKETSNIQLRFFDRDSNELVWELTLSKIVENTNRVDPADLTDLLHGQLARGMKDLPAAAGAP